MDIELTAFNSLYDNASETRCAIRYGRDVISQCLCSSFQTTPTPTEEGIFDAVTATVRLKKSDWIFNVKPDGLVIDFKRDSETEWTRCRVMSVAGYDKIYILNLQAENG